MLLESWSALVQFQTFKRRYLGFCTECREICTKYLSLCSVERPQKNHVQWEMYYLPPFSLRGCKSWWMIPWLVGWLVHQTEISLLCFFGGSHITNPASFSCLVGKIFGSLVSSKHMDDTRLQRIAKCTSCLRCTKEFLHPQICPSSMHLSHFSLPICQDEHVRVLSEQNKQMLSMLETEAGSLWGPSR